MKRLAFLSCILFLAISSLTCRAQKGICGEYAYYKGCYSSCYLKLTQDSSFVFRCVYPGICGGFCGNGAHFSPDFGHYLIKHDTIELLFSAGKPYYSYEDYDSTFTYPLGDILDTKTIHVSKTILHEGDTPRVEILFTRYSRIFLAKTRKHTYEEEFLKDGLVAITPFQLEQEINRKLYLGMDE